MLSLYIEEEPELQKVFDFLDKCHDKKDEEIKLYINCWGGNVIDFKAISRRLNWMLSLWYNITLHIMYAWSAAFTLCYEFTWKVELEEDADGMIHMVYMTVPVHQWVVIACEWTNRWRKQWWEKNRELLPPAYLTESEKELYANWFDVYINPDRMKEIFTK